jgi:hypothetical protein
MRHFEAVLRIRIGREALIGAMLAYLLETGSFEVPDDVGDEFVAIAQRASSAPLCPHDVAYLESVRIASIRDVFLPR